MMKMTCVWRVLSTLVLVFACSSSITYAQTPTPSPSPAATGTAAPTSGDESDYQIVSSIELGYRGLRVDGDINKYQSDLNYKAGPRVFDTSFLMRAKDGNGGVVDQLLITTTGWGSDPQGSVRFSAEKSEWYRFSGNYRRFKFFRFLNNIANPNYSTRPTDPATGQHGFDTRNDVGDFDLTILPKNEKIKFNFGYSPTRINGPAYTTWHFGGDDFLLLSQLKSRSHDFRVGADWKLGPIDFSFLQGFRRFNDDTRIDNDGLNLGVNPAANNASLTTFHREEPIRGSVNYSRLSAHTLIARKLDITGRIIYSNATTDFTWLETISAINFNTRISGIPPAYNPPGTVLTSGQFRFVGDTKRPNTLGDLGVTYLATNNFRISNTFKVETFQINGGALYNGVFNITRGTTVLAPLFPTGYSHEVTKYRKIQNTVEGDYEFNDRFSVRLGYRYGSRFIQRFLSGHNLANNGAPPIAPSFEEEENHTNAFIGGVTAQLRPNWTLYFSMEKGTADNVFTRTGNYDYTNIRARTRYIVNRNLRFNLAFISRDNANPSEISEFGTSISLEDFGVSVKSRAFTSSIDWTATNNFNLNAGYTYNWQNSHAIIEYAFGSGVPNAGIRGHSLYFVRNNFFYFDTTSNPFPRVSFYTSYRINKDTGQGNRISDPGRGGGLLVQSYPNNFQSAEGRLAIKINRRLDWNLGYQYYSYNESDLRRVESPFVPIRPQNYHAHLPYTSLRFYFGRKE
jgi:hypothetical protein